MLIPYLYRCNFSGNHTVHPESGSTASLVVEPGFAGPGRSDRGAAAVKLAVGEILLHLPPPFSRHFNSDGEGASAK